MGQHIKAQEKGQIFKTATLININILRNNFSITCILQVHFSLGAVFAAKDLFKIGTFCHAYRADIFLSNIVY